MRAIRKRYFARSAGEMSDQPFSNASRAARGGEVDVLRAGLGDLGQRLLVDGSIVVYVAGAGSSHSPPTKSAVALLERDDVARFRRRRVVPT